MKEPLFGPSMMVHFRKRFLSKVIEEIGSKFFALFASAGLARWFLDAG